MRRKWRWRASGCRPNAVFMPLCALAIDSLQWLEVTFLFLKKFKKTKETNKTKKKKKKEKKKKKKKKRRRNLFIYIYVLMILRIFLFLFLFLFLFYFVLFFILFYFIFIYIYIGRSIADTYHTSIDVLDLAKRKWTNRPVKNLYFARENIVCATIWNDAILLLGGIRQQTKVSHMPRGRWQGHWSDGHSILKSIILEMPVS